jgi:hypothetical protein
MDAMLAGLAATIAEVRAWSAEAAEGEQAAEAALLARAHELA